MAFVSDLADRAAASAWVAAEPGLAAAVAEWLDEVGFARENLATEAERAARPGPVSPDRLVAHAAAAGMSRAVRALTRLPGDIQSMAPVRDPQRWLLETGIEAFADQLALSGPASHEVARIIVGSGNLFPGVLRDELEQRTIETPIVDTDTVQLLADRHLAGVRSVGDAPITSLPVSQLHDAQLDDGRLVLLRVRRPGIARELRADARLSASGATAMNKVMPEAGGMGPIGFVELVTRYALEAVDMRFEALNVAELAIILEENGRTGIEVSHPLPGLVSKQAIAFEGVVGVPLDRYDGTIDDPAAAMEALTTITLESALVHGTFWADPVPDHLLVLRGGRLAMVGAGTVGHFTPRLRRAGITFLRSVMSGDAAGQVEAMRIAGAAPDDVDVDALVHDLESADALQVSQILFGGEQGVLNALSATVRVLLAHNIKPPVEVVLLLRTVFALDGLSRRIMPEGGGLMAALMGLLPRLPQLLNDAAGDS